MNRKNLIISLIAITVLLAAIVVSVFFLYSGSGDTGGKNKDYKTSDYRLLPAVPSDAAMIFCISDLKKTASILTDSSNVFNAFVSEGGKKNFACFLKLLNQNEDKLGSLKSSETVVSIHNSGDLVPMMIISAGNSPADTTSHIAALMTMADSAKVNCRLLDCSTIPDVAAELKKSVLLLVSSSETLLTASQRHVEGGMSIMDKENFPEAAKAMGGADAIFISHDYAGKIFGTFLNKPYSRFSGFFGEVADWTALEIKEVNSKSVVLKGSCSRAESPSCFANMITGSASGSPKFAEMLPASTLFATSIPIDNISSYIERYEKFMDASGRLDKRRRAASALKDSTGVEPAKWAGRLDIKEVCKAVVMLEGEACPMLFIRPGKEDGKIISSSPYEFRQYAATVFGNIMSIPDETAFVYAKGWIVAGSARSVDAYKNGAFGKQSLKDLLGSAGAASRIPNKNVSLVSYYAASENVPGISRIFKPSMADAFKASLAGLSYEPVIMAVCGEEITISADRISISRSSAVPVTSKDTVVVIPAGPFKVKNSATGKTNLFGQSPNMTLTLKEEEGKGIWGVPFKTPICGAAESIDYYANGKLQILFASGSKLYLIDRLGRFVSPFPIDLGKEILIGPGVYDFTGAKGYTAVVLHKDNTIGMYDLHGKAYKGWEGIKTSDTIKSLPELLEVKGKKYWVIRTSVQSLIYSFKGGEPLTKAEGDKMIRPDSRIEVKDGKISATSYDGKVRNIKL